MLRLKLSELLGIHPGFARIEKTLDVAPVALPDIAIMPKNIILKINELYPIVVVNFSGFYCVGHTTQYRWLAAHMPPETVVSCLQLKKSLGPTQLYRQVLIERLVMPALAQVTPQQVKEMYQHITPPRSGWQHDYSSHAHLARLVGVKPIKGKGTKKLEAQI